MPTHSLLNKWRHFPMPAVCWIMELTSSPLDILCASHLTCDLSLITTQWLNDLSQSPGHHHFSPSPTDNPYPCTIQSVTKSCQSTWTVSPWVMQWGSLSASKKKSKPTSNYSTKKRNCQATQLQPAWCHNQQCPTIKVYKREHSMNVGMQLKNWSWIKKTSLLIVPNH